VEWHWVRGHTGHRENEIADSLANRGIEELSRLAVASNSLGI
jgi:ribonuclease HI